MNSIIKFIKMHPNCKWNIRAATVKEQKMGGNGQSIDFVLEAGGLKLFMNDQEYLEVLDYLVEEIA